MKNCKGFTLVELLAMLTVLGILMVITVPNITGILSNNRLNVIKADANAMVEKAKMKIAKDNTITKPKANECVVLTLDYLNDNDDIKTGPNGGLYNVYESFVIFTRTGNQYKYYVRLVEETEEGWFGFNIVDSSTLSNLGNDSLEPITNRFELSKNQNESLTKINSYKPKTNTGENICSSRYIAYYAIKRP